MNVYEQTRVCKNSPIFNKDINRTIFSIAYQKKNLHLPDWKESRQIQVLKKYPLRDSEIPIVLEDFLLKNFNIQEFVFSFLTLKLRFLVGLSTDVREVSALVCGHGRLRQLLRQNALRCLDWI